MIKLVLDALPHLFIIIVYINVLRERNVALRLDKIKSSSRIFVIRKYYVIDEYKENKYK